MVQITESGADADGLFRETELATHITRRILGLQSKDEAGV
jgi:hypothetical protein